MRMFPAGLVPRSDATAANFPRSRYLLPNMIRVLQNKHELVLDGYDSDDEPSDLVGMRLSIMWGTTQPKWFNGTCLDYDPSTGQHLVLYDDNEKKWCVCSTCGRSRVVVVDGCVLTLYVWVLHVWVLQAQL